MKIAVVLSLCVAAFALSTAANVSSSSFTLSQTLRQNTAPFGDHPGFTDAPRHLFGNPRSFKAAPAPGVHPRVLFDADELNDLVTRYISNSADPKSFEKYFLRFTGTIHGPKNPNLAVFEQLPFDVSDDELAEYVHYWGKAWNGMSAAMTESSSAALIMMAFHAHVETARNPKSESPIFERLTKILGNWAKCILAHEKKYNSYASDIDPIPEYTAPVYNRSIWLFKQGSKLWQPTWTLTQEWRTGVFGMAIAYDMIYDKMASIPGGIEARTLTRKAISRILKGRISWGMDLDDRRIVSNWATYHSNLWLSALAIEGKGVDENIENILVEYPRVVKAFMTRAIYPDGSALEDAYTVGIALREGSNALIAGEKRGFGILSSQKFRNIVFHAAHMHEPWLCGNYVGGSSGGGLPYPSFYALARNVYPDGDLPAMLWRQRMGDNYVGGGVCRAQYQQVVTQLFHLGLTHKKNVPNEGSSLLPLHHFSPIRGMVVSRSAATTDALYSHFDARGDCAWLGHDNPDRGTFTLSAFGKTLVPEKMSWRYWARGSHHSLLHIDGASQELKAACATMRNVVDDGDMVIASADLSKSYSVQWWRAWANLGSDRGYKLAGYERETASPADYGWFTSTYDAEIGLPKRLWGSSAEKGTDNDFGFLGTYMYKKNKPGLEAAEVIRSTVTVRDDASPVSGGYMLIVDKASVGDGQLHNYAFHMVLHNDLTINQDRSTSSHIVLEDGNGIYFDVHVHSEAGYPTHRIEYVPGFRGQTAKVLVIASPDSAECEYWIALHPHRQFDEELQLQYAEGKLAVGGFSEGNSVQNLFTLDNRGSVVRAEAETAQTTTPTTTIQASTTSITAGTVALLTTSSTSSMSATAMTVSTVPTQATTKTVTGEENTTQITASQIPTTSTRAMAPTATQKNTETSAVTETQSTTATLVPTTQARTSSTSATHTEKTAVPTTTQAQTSTNQAQTSSQGDTSMVETTVAPSTTTTQAQTSTNFTAQTEATVATSTFASQAQTSSQGTSFTKRTTTTPSTTASKAQTSTLSTTETETTAPPSTFTTLTQTSSLSTTQTETIASTTQTQTTVTEQTTIPPETTSQILVSTASVGTTRVPSTTNIQRAGRAETMTQEQTTATSSVSTTRTQSPATTRARADTTAAPSTSTSQAKTTSRFVTTTQAHTTPESTTTTPSSTIAGTTTTQRIAAEATTVSQQHTSTDTEANPTTTSSDSAIRFVSSDDQMRPTERNLLRNPPVAAMTFAPGESIVRLQGVSLTSNSSRFLMPQLTYAPFQAVLQFNASTRAGKPRTNIHTCAEWTNCDTLITIVQCEDYEARQCAEVPGASNDDACHGTRSMVKKALVEGETYYAIAELWWADDGHEPRAEVTLTDAN